MSELIFDQKRKSGYLPPKRAIRIGENLMEPCHWPKNERPVTESERERERERERESERERVDVSD